MNRWTSFAICVAAGVLLVVCGLLIPAHLRAVDSRVLEEARRSALKGSLPPPEPVPELQRGQEPLTESVVRAERRQPLLQQLRGSPKPEVQALLRFRDRTNTVIFSPSQSASGQALDTAIVIAGKLMNDGVPASKLNDRLGALASDAERGGDPQELEQALLDLMSLGQRFTWDQLVAFVGHIDETRTLSQLTDLVRRSESELRALFKVVVLSGNPAAVADYLVRFNQTGLKDLETASRYGTAGLNELLRREQRLVVSEGVSLGASLSLTSPRSALALKWLALFTGGFLLALAMHFARNVPVPERSLHVRGFHLAREFLFGLGFLAVVLILSEPFLTQENQRVQVPFRLRVPMAGDAVQPGIAAASSTTSFMQKESLLTILLFFVIQVLLYIACLVKLAEIRRQPIPPRIKLMLLENEDHLFDAGVYLGFVGTIISFILVSLGVVKPSLMAAYSSTSFGIIFVSAFKIFNLRPLRRKLLLESENIPPVPAEPVPAAGAQPQVS